MRRRQYRLEEGNIIKERKRDGTGPEGKGPKTGRGKGDCDEASDYDAFFEKTLKKYAKKFDIKADINSFSKEQKKEMFDYIEKEWTADDE